MRTLQHILSILFLCVGLTSCFDSFLEENVYDFLSPNNFYTNEEEAISGVNGIYECLSTSRDGDRSFHRATLMIGDYPAESSSAQTSTVPYRLEFEMFTWNENTQGTEQVWAHFYGMIYRCNLMIEQLPGIKGNKELLSRLEGEARFMRALGYFYLIRLFENIPLVTSAAGSDLYPTNVGTSDGVWNLILEDLKFAETNLPDSYSGNDIGRATKGAAKAILAKAYLTMGGYPWNQKDKYALAAAKCEEIIKSNQYDLMGDYAQNFKEKFEHGKEYIFDVEFTSGQTGSNWVNMAGIRGQNVCRFAGWSAFGGTKNFYDDMLSKNQGDKRFPVNFILSFTDIKTGQEVVWGVDFDQTKSLYHTWKYTDPDETGAGDQESNINVHIIRYADVLLMHSEAVNNASGYTGTYDRNYGINKVRARAGMEPVHTGLSQKDFNDALVWERVVELCYEGQLWYDYKRLNVMKERAARKGFVVGEKYNVFPIPQNELDRNPNLEQHPLWK